MEDQADKKKKRLWLFIWLIVFALALVVFVTCLYFLWDHYFRPQETMEQIRSKVSASEEQSVSSKDPVPVPIDFEQLQQSCPDAYAWIKIPDTVIDYELVQYPEEGSFYLDHSSDRKKSVSGSIYTKLINNKDFLDYNTVIYGHNMRNGTMFGQLKKYKNKDFFNSHREIIIYMPGRILKYKVFAAYVWNDDDLLLSFDFTNPLVRASYWRQILAQRNVNAIIADDTTVTADGLVITLSTCTSRDDQRYLVQAVLIYDSDDE